MLDLIYLIEQPVSPKRLEAWETCPSDSYAKAQVVDVTGTAATIAPQAPARPDFLAKSSLSRSQAALGRGRWSAVGAGRVGIALRTSRVLGCKGPEKGLGECLPEEFEGRFQGKSGDQ